MSEIRTNQFRGLGWNKQGTRCPFCNGNAIFGFNRKCELKLLCRCGHLRNVIQNEEKAFEGYFSPVKNSFEGVVYKEIKT